MGFSLRKRALILGLSVASIGLANFWGPNAHAGNTWNGGGASNNWSDNNNWGGSAPGYGTLTFSGSTRTTNIDDNITAMNQLLWTGTNSWTLNQGGSTVLSLFDNGGTQAKIENQSSGTVTINLPIIFAANNGSPPNPFGEINAVSGDIIFGTGTLTVNGSSVNGIKMFGSNFNTTFNNTVSASGKWFAMTANNDIMNVGGSFTSGDIFVMNGGTLNVNSSGSITNSGITGVRLGGDFGTTGSQNQTLGGTLVLTSATGGQTFGSLINTTSGNTSNALLVNSTNASGTNTISGSIFLDSALTIQNTAGGTLALSSTSTDVKAQTLTLTAAGVISVTGNLTSSFGAGGTLVVNGAGTVLLSTSGNSYSGTNSGTLNGNSTLISGGGTLGIVDDTSLGVAPSGHYNNIQFTGSATLQDTSNNISLNSNRDISIASGATATFDTNGNNMTIGGIVNGSGGNLAKVGNGILTLNGNNSYSGTTSISTGTLQLGNTNALGNTSGTTVSSGAVLDLNGQAVANTAALTVDGTGIGATGAIINSSGTASFGGQIDAAGTHSFSVGGTNNFSLNGEIGPGNNTLTKVGSNTVTLGGTADNVNLSIVANNGTLILGKTSSGTVHALGSGLTIGGATVQLGGSGGDQIFDNSFVTINSGTFDLNGNSEAIDALSGSGGSITNTAGSTTSTLTVGANNGSGTYNGTIVNGASNTGIVAITKNGSGSLVLTGINTYTGETDINAGTLDISGGSSTTSTVFVGNGLTTGTAATLLLTATAPFTFTPTISVNPGNGSNRTIGGTNTSGVNTYSGMIEMNGLLGENRSVYLNAAVGGEVDFTNTISGSNSTQNVTINSSGTGGTVRLAGNNTYTGTTTVNGGTLLVDGTITSDTTVNSGGALGGNGTITGNVEIKSGGLAMRPAIRNTSPLMEIFFWIPARRYGSANRRHKPGQYLRLYFWQWHRHTFVHQYGGCRSD